VPWRRVLLVHAGFLLVGLGLLLALALPVTVWEGINPTDSGAMSWTVPSALVVGVLCGALEGILLRLLPALGWIVGVIACFLGSYVPATFVGGWPGADLPGSSAGVAAAWFGWLLFLVVLTAVAEVVLTVRPPKGKPVPELASRPRL